MKRFPTISTKFPDLQEETLAFMFSVYQKNNTVQTDFEAWFLQTFATELDVVDWLLDLDTSFEDITSPSAPHA